MTRGTLDLTNPPGCAGANSFAQLLEHEAIRVKLAVEGNGRALTSRQVALEVFHDVVEVEQGLAGARNEFEVAGVRL